MTRVWSGKDGRILWTVGRWITTLSALGDVNGDGRADVVAGEAGTARAILILSGQDGSVLRRISDPSDVSFGFRVAGIGDTDNDGVPDVIHGSPQFTGSRSSQGRVQILSGRTGQVLLSATGAQGFDRMGEEVANAGDVNADGVDDILVRMSGVDSRGWVFVVAGRTFQVLHTFSGQQDYDIIQGPRGIGDVNRDGHADFLIRGFRPSRVDLYSGRDGSLLHTRAIQTTDDCAGVGDTNRDGWPDFSVRTAIISGRNYQEIARLSLP
jgi:hypothetical protein